MQNCNVMACPKHKTKNFKGSFKYAAAKIWNNIPPPLQTAMSYLTFKRKMKHHILEKQILVAATKYIFKK